MRSELRPAILMTVVLTLVTGVLYPLAVTGIAAVVFPWQAHGSLITRAGTTIGSALLGQGFSDAAYFHPRPSAAGENGYDAAGSSGSNLGPIDARLLERVEQSVAALREENPTGRVPVDLVTTSGSGLDPHVTPAAAAFQVARVAAARHAPEEAIRALVGRHTEGRQLGFLGEPRVNVLLLNLDLDAAYPR
jgi:K+-transporting ATPase ATPase C chain